ncbi:MAG: hypothetical protein GF393_01595 [Armatimonadia bacterium]|nr:hypothetical protein [Armatimonadia bacterium]
MDERRVRTLTADELDLVLRGTNVTGREKAKVRAAVEWLLWRASASRADVKEFFTFVMREEHTGKPVRCMPHQRVLFDFWQAHPQCVTRMPVGSSKTFCLGTWTLWQLGRDPTERGAVVSATQNQASKPLAMVRDHVETNVRLRMVWPKLRKSRRRTDPWTEHAITVERPPGIRDASLRAVGIDGALPGSRLSFCNVDDILTRENTYTKQSRTKVHEWFDSTALSRLDDDDSRCAVTNTAWHPDDLTFRLEEAGWPTLSMDAEGNVWITNSDEWDTDDIRPAWRTPGEYHRLTAHDDPAYAEHAGEEEQVEALRATREELGLDGVAEPVVYSFLCAAGLAPLREEWVDEQERVPLWPERLDRAHVEQLKRKHLPHRYNQLYRQKCRDDATARCKSEWIEQCKDPSVALASKYEGSGLTVTGVDLAVGKNEASDFTAFFTFEQLANGKRRILDVEFGQFDAPTIVQKVIDKAHAYRSIVRVENNAAQDYILQFARAQNASVPVKAHATGRSKAHPEYGVESIFVELMNAAWVIPCDRRRRVQVAVQRWIDECLQFTPDGHTGDVLMACWLAKEQARALGSRVYSRVRSSQAQSAARPMVRNVMVR